MGVVVVAGGTNGMGREFAAGRAARGDEVVTLGRGPTATIRVDLSSVAQTQRTVADLLDRYAAVDALALFANGLARRRTLTPEGLERTFALYYLSRYLLSFGLRPALDRASKPVIVNVAGVGVQRGAVRWDDPHFAGGYSMVAAQLQAGRANDLLGVAFAARARSRARYVLYHPGFTKSGDRGPLPRPARALLAVAALAARPVAASVAPIHRFVDEPPSAALTAVDRDKVLPLDLPTLDPADADRLLTLTEHTLTALRSRPAG